MIYILNSMISGRVSICPSYENWHMEMNEDKVHKRRLWSKVHQFAYKYIRIIGSFHGLDKMLTMPMENFNASSIKKLASRIDTDHNGDMQIEEEG